MFHFQWRKQHQLLHFIPFHSTIEEINKTFLSLGVSEWKCCFHSWGDEERYYNSTSRSNGIQTKSRKIDEFLNQFELSLVEWSLSGCPCSFINPINHINQLFRMSWLVIDGWWRAEGPRQWMNEISFVFFFLSGLVACPASNAPRKRENKDKRNGMVSFAAAATAWLMDGLALLKCEWVMGLWPSQ